MANQKSVSETRATGKGVAGGVAVSGVGSEGPIVGTWSQAAPWDDPTVRSRRLTIMAGVGLGFLAVFAVAGALARQLGSSALACATGAECSQIGVNYAQGAGGMDKDEALGARLFQRACDLGDP